MPNLKFDKNGNLIPQKIKYIPKRDEETEDMIEKYIENECNFRVRYDNEENAIFTKKGKK